MLVPLSPVYFTGLFVFSHFNRAQSVRLRSGRDSSPDRIIFREWTVRLEAARPRSCSIFFGQHHR